MMTGPNKALMKDQDTCALRGKLSVTLWTQGRDGSPNIPSIRQVASLRVGALMWSSGGPKIWLAAE